MKTRLTLFTIFFLFGISALLFRLFFWQIVKSSDLTDQARYQHQNGQRIVAERGNILSSDGSLLAASTQTWLVFVQKSEITESTKTIANKLAPLIVDYGQEKDLDTNTKRQILLDETNRIQAMLDRKDLVWVPIKHRLDSDTKKNILALNIKGVGFDPEETRFYPEGSSSAHVLGFVGKDDEGIDKGYFPS
ncbi:hypothetical protein KW795_03115, partial [Candidatus Microgenomates bacterium]|nr:hypothetical protein [Candidatus Microgenomates bacterium]